MQMLNHELTTIKSRYRPLSSTKQLNYVIGAWSELLYLIRSAALTMQMFHEDIPKKRIHVDLYVQNHTSQWVLLDPTALIWVHISWHNFTIKFYQEL